MSLRRGSVVMAAAIAAAVAGIAPTMSLAAPAAAAAVDSTGNYYPRFQTRILDTRSGVGAAKAPLGAGKEILLQVGGKGYVPAAGASAVVLNLTGIGPLADTYLTAYPSGTTRPSSSSLNVPKGTTRANLVTVPVGADGKVRIFNGKASMNVLADVVGFYAKDSSIQGSYGAGLQFQMTEPSRFYDSREDFAFAPGERASFGVIFEDPAAAANARGLVMNITVTSPTRSGFLRAWSGATAAPAASTLNFGAGQTVPNMAIVPTRLEGADQAFDIQNDSAGTVHIIIDTVGYYDTGAADGLHYKSLNPVRLIDSRSGVGGPAGAFAPNTTKAYVAPAAVAGVDTWALVANTTAVAPTAQTFLTVWGDDPAAPTMPFVSNVNAAAGQTVANATITPMGPGNGYKVYNWRGSTNVLMDVTGSFEYAPAAPAAPQSGGALSQAAPAAKHLKAAPQGARS